jgi:hypothetical protein
MTDCKHTIALLNDYVDKVLPDELAAQVESHCQGCASCGAELAALRQQADIIGSMPLPRVPEGLGERVISRAILAAEGAGTPARPVHSQPKLVAGFAMAAMLSALVVWLGFIDTQLPADDPLMFMVDNEVRNVTVAIDAEDGLDDVSMHVEISDNLEVQGFGSRKTISWTTHLKPGVNVISLPVIGIAQGDGEITTRIKSKGKQKVMRIKTRYKQPGSVYLDSYHYTGSGMHGPRSVSSLSLALLT